MFRRRGYALAGGLSLWATLAWGELPMYTISELPGMAVKIDKEGPTVVGTQQVDGNQTAFRLSPTVQSLGTLPGGLWSVVGDVFRGRVVGASEARAAGPEHAFLYENGQMRDLGASQPFERSSVASAVNSDDICGWATPSDPQQWRIIPTCRLGDTWVEYPTLGGQDGYVLALNEAGNAAGTSQTASGAFHCTYWPVTGGAVDCHTDTGTDQSWVDDMNSRNQIVGYTYDQGPYQAFVALPWGMILLPPITGDVHSKAHGINDLGLIAGESFIRGQECEECFPARHAAVVWEAGKPVDLQTRLANPDGWVLQRALGINNDGLIIVEGRLNGVKRSGLLTPVDDRVTAWYKWRYMIQRYYAQRYDRWRKQIAQYYYRGIGR